MQSHERICKGVQSTWVRYVWGRLSTVGWLNPGRVLGNPLENGGNYQNFNLHDFVGHLFENGRFQFIFLIPCTYINMGTCAKILNKRVPIRGVDLVC